MNPVAALARELPGESRHGVGYRETRGTCSLETSVENDRPQVVVRTTVAQMGRLVFVRHSKPIVTPETARPLWPLSPQGHSLSVELGKKLDLNTAVDVVASTERKAVYSLRI